MLTLSELIDFDSFDRYQYESIDDNGDDYIMEKDNDTIPYYIDHEIEHDDDDKQFVIKKIKVYNKFFYALSFRNFNSATKIKLPLKKSKHYTIEHTAAYEFGNYYIIYMRIIYKSDQAEVSIAGIIHRGNDPKYIFIGANGEKYFIHSHLFSYADSSGIAVGDGFLIDPKIYQGANSESEDSALFLSSDSTIQTIMLALTNTLNYILEDSVNSE